MTTEATGTFTATLDGTTQTLTWTLSVPSITEATAAHIHVGAVGENGAVVVNLFAAPEDSPADSVDTSGTATAAELTGPLEGDWDAFVSALTTGGLYVNVHTTANAGGEIRGQLVTAGEPPTAGDGQIVGDIPSTGFGLVTFGGTIDQLDTALAGAGCDQTWATSAGAFVVYIPTTAVAAVNAQFLALWAGGSIPAATPLLLGNC